VGGGGGGGRNRGERGGGESARVEQDKITNPGAEERIRRSARSSRVRTRGTGKEARNEGGGRRGRFKRIKRQLRAVLNVGRKVWDRHMGKASGAEEGKAVGRGAYLGRQDEG